MFQIATLPRLDLNTELLVVFLEEKFVKQRQKSYQLFPEEVRDSLQSFFTMRDFKGKLNETALIYPANSDSIKRILCVGIGSEDKLSTDEYRNFGKLISEKQEKLSVWRVHIMLANLKNCREDLIRCFSEGVIYQNYHFDEYKTDKKPKKRQARFIFLCNKVEYTPRFRQILLETEAVMRGVLIARNLANQPSNQLTPTYLKKYAINYFEDHKNINVKVLEKRDLEKQKFGALLAVAKGSIEPPALIILHYHPDRKTSKKVALVGKGVTFDSGGISIKPAANMEEMKFDMSGAAAVMGSMEVVASLKPKYEVIAAIPAVENMPGGNAVKPGDVITAYNGKTIEVINTDAEGRLILADALAYVQKEYQPKYTIDFATLTGACVVALGDKNAGLFSNSDKLVKLLHDSGQNSGDAVWAMPMDDIYNKDIESEVADLKNVGERWAGAITAAKFLEAFVGKQAWAHIDIAGTAYNVKHKDYLGKGATGFGVRLIGRSLKAFDKLF